MTAVLFALAFALLLASGYAVAGLLVRGARASLARLEPVARAQALSRAAFAPAVLAVTGVVACALPSMVATVGLAEDHCDHHTGHVHLCLLHAPHAVGTPASTVALGLGVLVALVIVRELVRWVSSGHTAAALVRGARLADGVHVVDSEHPFSAAIGLFRPVVVVSRGLVGLLVDDEVRAVLAHERAHVERRDALRLAVVRALWSVTPRWLSEPLLTELAVACEEACDRHAADAVGDPLVVAEAIVKAARAARRGPALVPKDAVAFGPGATERRVRALIAPTLVGHARGRDVPLLSITAVIVLMLAGPIHHLTETFLGIFLG